MPNMRTDTQRQRLYADCSLAFPGAGDTDCYNFGYNTSNTNSVSSMFSNKPTLTINGKPIKTLEELRSKVETSGGKRTKRRKSKRKTKKSRRV